MSREAPDPFFIVGLPRSGTAWLSVALTCGPISCLHETIRGVPDFSIFAERVEAQRAWAQVIGEASPSLPFYAQQVANRWPNARYVFIRRDTNEAGAAYARALGVDENSVLWQEIVHRFEAHRLALSDHHVLEIPFDQVFTAFGLARIWRHVASQFANEFPLWRLRQLVDMRIVVDQTLAMQEGADAILFPPPETRPPDFLPVLSEVTGSDAEAEYCAFVRDLCGENEDAWQWFVDVIGYVKLWDHIHDGDAIHRGFALSTLENVLLKWPSNPFWFNSMRHLTALLDIAVDRWKRGNVTGDVAAEYEGYRLLAVAIGAVLGKRIDEARLDELMTALLKAEPRLQPQPA